MRKRFLIVGGGSMGKRRLRCLLANHIAPEQLRLVELRADRREECRNQYGVDGFGDLDAGLAWNPEVVFVSVPGALHLGVCQAAARAGKHIFCEVPLSVNLDGLEDLTRIVAEKHLLLAPGCQPPFHPLYRQLKEWVAAPDFGPPLLIVEIFGQYLPDWHPYEDYRTFYAARGGLPDSPFPWGRELRPEYAWYGGQSAPKPVGSYPPNGYGLHDIVGNIWEWCADVFEHVSAGCAATNAPTGKEPRINRVLRGGSYLTKDPLNLWVAYRHEDPPDLRHECIGFRVAITARCVGLATTEQPSRGASSAPT